MSVLFENEIGTFISHEEYIGKIYAEVEKQDGIVSYVANEDLFNIHSPYAKKDRRKTPGRKKGADDNAEGFEELKSAIEFVRSAYNTFRTALIENEIISPAADGESTGRNEGALRASDAVYKETAWCDIEGAVGENRRERAVSVRVNGREFLFPGNCKFYCCNVDAMREKLGAGVAYDLIVVDPPWWNKYIRRRKRKRSDGGYGMMYNGEVSNVPVGSLVHDGSLVVVWCTNSESHLADVKRDVLRRWGLQYKTTWYWLKVTSRGEPVCDFGDPPGKQPFEQIVMATRKSGNFSQMTGGRIVVSVPSALHSNKPPLNEILSKYLPENPRCLEIFARYLLPNTTSYGLEAIRFQHCSLYTEKL